MAENLKVLNMLWCKKCSKKLELSDDQVDCIQNLGMNVSPYCLKCQFSVNLSSAYEAVFEAKVVTSEIDSIIQAEATTSNVSEVASLVVEKFVKKAKLEDLMQQVLTAVDEIEKPVVVLLKNTIEKMQAAKSENVEDTLNPSTANYSPLFGECNNENALPQESNLEKCEKLMHTNINNNIVEETGSCCNQLYAPDDIKWWKYPCTFADGAEVTKPTNIVQDFDIHNQCGTQAQDQILQIKSPGNPKEISELWDHSDTIDDIMKMEEYQEEKPFVHEIELGKWDKISQTSKEAFAWGKQLNALAKCENSEHSNSKDTEWWELSLIDNAETQESKTNSSVENQQENQTSDQLLLEDSTENSEQAYEWWNQPSTSSEELQTFENEEAEWWNQFDIFGDLKEVQNDGSEPSTSTTFETMQEREDHMESSDDACIPDTLLSFQQY